MTWAKRLPGLPAHGPPATAFPAEWGRLGREGLVVEFTTERGSRVGNFRPGLGGLDFLDVHPDEESTVVIASGDLWVASPANRTAEPLLSPIFAALEVRDPEGWVFSRGGIALARLGPSGLIWHTRRLSWDGFDQIVVSGAELTGLAWSPIAGRWQPFRVDLESGRSTGGSFSDEDTEGWETLAG